jgi:hypothetical protein
MGASPGRNGTLGLALFGIRNKMTLKSALQDVKETTLSGVAGLLGKLTYLASLRQGQGRYQHWGMEAVHGSDTSERALRTAHAEVLKNVLRSPLSALEEEVRSAATNLGVDTVAYVNEMRVRFQDLLPEGRQDAASAEHLNSVLVALSHLEKNRGRATRLVS